MMNDMDAENDADQELFDLGKNYNTPSRAAVIAAVSVAVAVFIFGAFIKTYRQLGILRSEAKKEVATLRSEIEELKTCIVRGDGQLPRSGIAAVPPAGRFGETQRENAIPPGKAPAASERLTAEPYFAPAPTPPVLNDRQADEQNRTPVISTSSGLSALLIASKSQGSQSQEARQTEENRIRVIAVNSGQKKLMVEGGRDKGIAEGGRLELSRSGRWIGDLRVVAVFDNISACEVLHCTMLPEPGDVVRVPMQPVS